MVIEDEAFHMPANGSAYLTDNTKYHNFFNGSEIERVHLVRFTVFYNNLDEMHLSITHYKRLRELKNKNNKKSVS